MLHWIFHALFVLFVAALICALGYGCDRIYLDDMVQRGIVARLSSERSADIASASAHATACAADVSAAVKAGVAIGRISAPRHRAAGSPQPMVTAGQITEAIR